jgi:hypothetical protein
MDQWSLEGDAYIGILSSSNPIAGSPCYPEKLRDPKVCQKLIDFINSKSKLWMARDLEKETAQTRGQAVFINSELNGAVLAADLDKNSGAFKSLEARLENDLKSALSEYGSSIEALTSFKVESAHIMLFLSGEASLAFNVSIARGWSDGSFQRLFGPEMRNTTTFEITRVLTELHADFQGLATRFVSDVDGLSARDLYGNVVKPKSSIEPVNSLNLIYAGAPGARVSPVLPDVYRDLVYPNGAADVVSQSPFRDEFVFFGYAFGLIATAKPQERLDELSLVPRLLHVAFNNLTAVSNAVRDLRSGRERMSVDTIASYYGRLQGEIRSVLSPTMMFRHEMLLLRDAIIDTWFVRRSIEEAETLLKGLVEDERRRHEERERWRGWALNIVLAFLALISMISVAADAKELGWWPFN